MIFSIFFTIICNAMLCAFNDLRSLIYTKMGGKYIT